jgi:hypothetical protein
LRSPGRSKSTQSQAEIVEALKFSRAEQVLGLSGDEGAVLEVDLEEEDGQPSGGHQWSTRSVSFGDFGSLVISK